MLASVSMSGGKFTLNLQADKEDFNEFEELRAAIRERRTVRVTGGDVSGANSEYVRINFEVEPTQPVKARFEVRANWLSRLFGR